MDCNGQRFESSADGRENLSCLPGNLAYIISKYEFLLSSVWSRYKSVIWHMITRVNLLQASHRGQYILTAKYFNDYLVIIVVAIMLHLHLLLSCCWTQYWILNSSQMLSITSIPKSFLWKCVCLNYIEQCLIFLFYSTISSILVYYILLVRSQVSDLAFCPWTRPMSNDRQPKRNEEIHFSNRNNEW